MSLIVEKIGEHEDFRGIEQPVPDVDIDTPLPTGFKYRRITLDNIITKVYGENAWPTVPDDDIENGSTNGYSRYPCMTPDGEHFIIFHTQNDRCAVIRRDGSVRSVSSAEGGPWVGENDNVRVLSNKWLSFMRNGSGRVRFCDLDFNSENHYIDLAKHNDGEWGHDDHIVGDWDGKYFPYRYADGRSIVVDTNGEVVAPLGYSTGQPNVIKGFAQGWNDFYNIETGESHTAKAPNGKPLRGHEGYAWTHEGDQVWVVPTESEHIWTYNPRKREWFRLFWTKFAAPGFHIANMPPECPGWALMSFMSRDPNSHVLANEIIMVELPTSKANELQIDWGGDQSKPTYSPRIIRVSPTYTKFTRHPGNLPGIQTEPSASANLDRMRDELVVTWRTNQLGTKPLMVVSATVPMAEIRTLTGADAPNDPAPDPNPTPTPDPETPPDPAPEQKGRWVNYERRRQVGQGEEIIERWEGE